ncbi:hypothetical protein [Oceaniglobus trochenteri]|uniref:hypothetical protein n=1 Tax=Oceaniglobus trochenteri TaxID=2763260 RepID=UPI001D000665|nr:hypothetical protein [Oceaniglobus trochenteri]
MNSPVFPAIDLPHLASVRIPDFIRLRLRQPDLPPLDDAPGMVAEQLSQSGLFTLPERAEIAVAVGSRGIAQIDAVARAAVDWLKGRGYLPFIVPGMGSHGGGTAEGQVGVLAALGITEATMGCPIRATMDTADYGTLPDGTACRFDAHAAGADGVLVINRIKAHTSFDRPIESGLSKMLAVGLGKAEGAGQVHRVGPRGLAETLPALARRIVEHAPLVAGIALVENAHKQLSHMETVAPAAFGETDARLLAMAKGAMARLPFDQLDGLIIERLGKEISGAGIDPAISGRTDIRGVENPARPFIHKIAILRLTDRTGGNGIGVGMADFMPRCMADALDLKAMYMNAVTSTMTDKAYIPIVLPDDRAVIRALVATCWAEEAPRLCQIRSSAHLDEIAVTPNLLPELQAQGDVIDHDAPAPLQFDGEGNLLTRLER